MNLNTNTRINGPIKTIKDDSFDFSNNRLVKNRNGDFVLRPLDLKRDGLNAIVFRCFSKDGSMFVDLPASILITKCDEQIEQLLQSGDSKVIWQKSEDIDKENPLYTPLCNLYITDAFPDQSSKVFKYRGNRGRSMDIGIIDLAEKGRVFVLGGSHLMIDGMGQSKNFAAHLHDIPINPNLSKKVKYPPYFIFPPLPRIEKVNESLRALGLTDVVVIQDLDTDGKLATELKKFNDLVVAPKTEKIKKLLVRENFSDKDAEKISRMFTQFLSRSTLIQSVAEAFVGKMVNIAALKEQTYHRMGMAVTQSLPESLLSELSNNNKELSLFFRPDLSTTLYKTLEAISYSRMEVVAASYGISVLGGIQALLNFYQENIKQPTDFIYTQLLDLSRQTGFISDKTVKEPGDMFIAAQNHQEKTMGLFIGLLKNKVTARINIEYPQYLNKLDIGVKIDESVLDEVLGEGDNDITKMHIKAIGIICKDFSKDAGVDNVGIISKLIATDLFNLDGEEKIKVIRLFLIAHFYQNIRNITKTSYLFLKALNDAIELNKDNLIKDGFLFDKE